MKKLLALLGYLVLASCSAPGPVYAVWFNAPPNTIVDSTTPDPTAQDEVNGNFSALIADGNTGQSALLSMITGLGPIGIPSGAVVAFVTSSCPVGYQVANGTNGTADARGVYIRGWDYGGAVDPGRAVGSYQADTFKQHQHGTIGVVTGVINTSSAFPSGTSVIFSVSATASPTTSTMINGSPGSETRPQGAVVLYCEKL